MRSQRTTILRAIASQLQRIKNCELPESMNPDCSQAKNKAINRVDAQDNLQRLEHLLPSGAGIDNGTKIDYDKSTPMKIVLNVDFHYMNDGGYYDGWTTHTIVITPSFDGFDIRVTGRNRNGMKEYFEHIYDYTLKQEIEIFADEVIEVIWRDSENPKRTEANPTGMSARFDPIYAGM